VLIRALPSRRPASAITWAGLALTLFALTACAEREPANADAAGQLFARGLSETAKFYIAPVSSRRLALSGAAWLSRLDNKLAVADSLGTHFADAITVSYDGRDIAFYATPPDNDSRQWGDLITRIIAIAKEVSPRLAALPQEKVQTAVFSGMTAALDRFSRYSGPALARDQRAARDGFGGIGVTLDTTDETFRVTAVARRSPAERSGIRPEDHIVAINGDPTAGDPHQDVVHQLRGPIGSAVTVSVRHAGMVRPRDVKLRRAYVVLPTVTMSRDGNIAVFRITSFNHSTTQRIAKGLADAEQQTGGHLAGIVLDLRGNPGGLLDQAVSLADLFIAKGPIVSTVGRHPASRQYFAAAGDSIAPHLPIVVLINGGSASASEIVAAALQDVGRAVVIGTSSYGKGTVQTVLRLPNDGELIVTWARLVTPSGYFLQVHGVVPTLCTADLRNAASGLAVRLERGKAAEPGAGLALRPRAGLDERGWLTLRRSCPPAHTRPAIDLQLAKRMIENPKLYSEVLNALPATTRLAENAPAGAAPEPVLTDGDRALSSRSR
jgi:carboxyl-terminal processing protease